MGSRNCERRVMPTLFAYLRLVRLPAVFTAMPDVLLGYALTHGVLAARGELLLLLAASSGLYLAGMVFNDVFDRAHDARFRPQRPIPSGAVPLTGAIGLGTLLVMAGIAAASLVGPQSLLVAGLLTLCVFGYDGGLKRTPIGPLVMGSCRSLNVMLGASALPKVSLVWGSPQWEVAVALGTYIAGVTWFARKEETQSARSQLLWGMAVVNAGLAGLFLVVATRVASNAAPLVLAVLAVVMLSINRRLSAAVFEPSPRHVQIAVKTMLLSLIVIDAVMVFWRTANPAYALLTASLLIPAALLGRWIPVT
jgi:4-hydroxybenzoate polyprenyltransferase